MRVEGPHRLGLSGNWITPGGLDEVLGLATMSSLKTVKHLRWVELGLERIKL